MSDLKFAFRQLFKSPLFTAVAVLTLAVGIGANTAIFSLAKAVILRPLGFQDEEGLMWLRLVDTRSRAVEDRLSWREIQDIRESAGSFESVATFGSPGAIWERGDHVEDATALKVTPNLGTALVIRPALGRMLLSSDGVEGAEPVVLISHELWQSHFGGSSDVIGQTVRLDQKSRTIVGVLPRALRFPLERAPLAGTGSILRADVQSFWFPMEEPRGEDRVSRGARMFLPVARLKPGVSEEMARAELAALGERLAAEFPETNRYRTFDLVSFRNQILGGTRYSLAVLAATVASVWLICCVNLANLLLARGVERQREVAVRLALGAGRKRVARALLAETMLLSLLGGGLGIFLAIGAVQTIRVAASASVPFVGEARLDGAGVLFTTVLSLVTALLTGLMPALRQSRLEATDCLRTGVRTTGDHQIKVWQQGLLVSQIAVVLVLLVAAGSLLESFRRLTGQDLGYQARSVLALDLDTWGFKTNEEVCRLYRFLHTRFSALPGVQHVGTISSAPLTGRWTFDEKANVVGQPVPEAERPSLAAGFVAFDYFQAMEIPLIEGRFFRDSELSDSGYGQIVILNQSAAELLFPGRSALGERFTVGSNPDRVLEVIGVVKDTREVRLEEKPKPRFYWQYAFGGAQVIVRSTAPPEVLIPSMRDILRPFSKNITKQEFRPMVEIISASVAERRFLTAMLAAYAAIALGIAAVGIFGVIGYQVARRTNEFGVRLALGSSAGGLLRLVLLQSIRLVLVGLAIGAVASVPVNRLLASQLFDLSPHDPILLTGAGLLFLLVALLASFLPASRAARLDPMEALRYE